MEIQDLKINETYSNQNITDAFKCAPQGGMRKSNTTNTLVLISNHTGKSIYGDRWLKGKLHYTGEGQEGDQSLNIRQNKTLARSPQLGIEIYLFEVFKDRKYTYAGEVELDSSPYFEKEPDRNGNERVVYRFPLKLLSQNYSPDAELVNNSEKVAKKNVDSFSSEELNKTAQVINKKNQGKKYQFQYVKTKVYKRNPAVREYVKKLANGVCQLCKQDAPFKVDGLPYLHVHHIEYLADGGEDTIKNSIALCPNCHERIHALNLAEDKDILIQKVKERKI